MIKVFMIHGYDSSPNKNWFQWLAKKFDKMGIQTHIPALPNPANPTPKLWLEFLQKECVGLDENTYFIAHSLGCITTLLFLQSLNVKIGGFILVSGFENGLEAIPQLRAFTASKLDHNKIINSANKRLVIAASNDSIVPCALTHSLASNLKAYFIQLPDGNHFMTSDGFNDFPLLAYLFKKMLKNN